jgi:hypothetical protein
MVFFAWGEIFSLFPATCTDLYGKKFATANYGMLYTSKGTAALLVPLANVLKILRGGDPQYHRRGHGASRVEAPSTQIRYAIARVELPLASSIQAGFARKRQSHVLTNRKSIN